MATITGTPGNDTLLGTSDDDQIDGGAGDDILIGGLGADALVGGADIDTVSYEDNWGGVYVDLRFGQGFGNAAQGDTYSGIENVIGSIFADGIVGDAGVNRLDGAGGDDILIGGLGADVLVGGAGIDTASYEDNWGAVVVDFRINQGFGNAAQGDSYVGIENIRGSIFNDFLISADGVNRLEGGNGDDTLIGGLGADVLVGGAGIDTASYEDNWGGVFIDLRFGNGFGNAAQGDTYESIENVNGSIFNDGIVGDAGVNRLDGGNGDDTLYGGLGADVLVGGAGIDTASYEDNWGAVFVNLSGGVGLGNAAEGDTYSGIENVSGSIFGDFILGSDGANFVNGAAGADFIDGGAGADVLQGGDGSDTFSFSTALGPANIDTVVDFVVGADTIQLGGAAGNPFAALASGALAAGAFAIGTTAADANDYLIYNSGTGALMYDADGNGAGAAVQFATLGTGLALTAASFTVSGPANNPPAITSGATPSIPENSAAGTIVYQTVASDADGDRITYSLTGADASLLTIDGSGAVRLISPADFETKSTYLFNVVASDSGSSTSKGITLTITDVADAATPIINEVAAANDGTGSAQAIDRNTFTIADNPNLPNDDLPSATIVGSVSSDTDKDYFSITLQAGELLILDVDGTLNAAAPGESLDSFVRVFDSNGVQLVSNDDQQSFDQGSVPTIASHNTDSYLQFRASTAGTYYFSIEAFDQLSAGNYRINVSIGPPATPQQLIEEDVDALISGLAWNHTGLTYGFPTQAGQYPSTFREVSPTTDFQPFSAGQQAATRQLLQIVANVSGLTFAELTGGTDHLSGAGFADLRYAMSTDSEVTVAYAYLPTNGGSSSAGGSAWFNTTSFNTPIRGNFAWMAILHETGHALGLKHGHEAPAIRPERDSTEYSIMTYRSYPGDPMTGGYSNGTYSFPQTLMMYDIAALQEMYGANFAFNAGNTVYSWDPNVGETSINGSSGQAPVGLGSGESSNRVFLTIWDGGGTDTYDLSAYSTATTIDLRPGEWTTTSTVQLANLGDGNFARGNVANALMYQGNTASLIENAVGGSGGDTIIANQVANSLTGGAGPDTFTWKANTDAGVGAAADTITDFLRGSDIIRLTDIDTNPGTGADDAFTFIGTGAFTNAAGQLRYQVEGGNLRVQADFDGNGIADMEIVVMNNTIFAASDFFL